MKVFLISPVAKATSELNDKIGKHIALLEQSGIKVHWPIRDTNQKDPTGGYEICKINAQAILEADEIQIWYDEQSGGSKFDMGIVFVLTQILGYKKNIVIVNEKEILDNSEKSLFKVFSYINGQWKEKFRLKRF